jgi:hypothetical protein
MLRAYHFLCRQLSVKLWLEDVFQEKLANDVVTEILDGVSGVHVLAIILL